MPRKRLSPETMERLASHEWKGNVRELENSVERAVVMSTSPVIELSDFLLSIPDRAEVPVETQALSKVEVENGTRVFRLKVQKSLPFLQEVVQKYIEFAVARNGGAKDRTAKEIGIDRKTLYRKMKNYENFVQ